MASVIDDKVQNIVTGLMGKEVFFFTSGRAKFYHYSCECSGFMLTMFWFLIVEEHSHVYVIELGPVNICRLWNFSVYIVKFFK